MTAADYLMNARKSLEALSTLLQEAAAKEISTDRILDDAMVHLREATRIIESLDDDEGTE
jgi:hypothetical protein